MIDSIVSKMRSGAIQTIEGWDAAMGEVGATLEEEIRCLMACAIKVPEHAMLISSLFANWRSRQYTKKISTVKGEGVEIPAHLNSNFTVDCIICLESRTSEGTRYLQRWGKWWKVQRGYSNNTQWMLQSLYGGKNKREEPKSKVELLTIGKAGDLVYNVVNVIKFPCSVEDIP